MEIQYLKTVQYSIWVNTCFFSTTANVLLWESKTQDCELKVSGCVLLAWCSFISLDMQLLIYPFPLHAQLGPVQLFRPVILQTVVASQNMSVEGFLPASKT